MQVLKADTQVKVRIGPFVDKTNGLTPETGIALGVADEAELLKHNGAATVDISGATWAAIANCDGWYDLTLTTSHTDTEGLLTIVVHDDSVCLPVFAHFMVINANVYASLYEVVASDYLDVQVKGMDADVVTASALNTDAVTEIWNKAMSDLAAGAPSATCSVLAAINYLYEAWRNKVTVTSSEIAVYKNDGLTKLVESDITDDDTTFTRAEFGAAD